MGFREHAYNHARWHALCFLFSYVNFSSLFFPDALTFKNPNIRNILEHQALTTEHSSTFFVQVEHFLLFNHLRYSAPAQRYRR